MALFSCYVEGYVDFLPFSRALAGGGGWLGTFGLFGSALEGHGSPVRTTAPVNTYMCIPTKFKDDICRDYLLKVHVNSPLP